MTHRTILYWHSLRHTRMSQLLARSVLSAKRKTMVQVARWTGPTLRGNRPSADTEGLPVVSAFPRPLFAPRRELVVEEGGQPQLCLLNRRFPLEFPCTWHDPSLEHGTRLEKLNLHYMEYLEAVDDVRFARLVEDWVAHNAPYRPGYWLDCWNSYALSIRVVVWMQQYALRWKGLSEHVRAILLSSLVRQTRFLRRNLELDIRGNHLIKNIKALLWASRFFQGPEAHAWGRLGQQLLRQELREQVLADGMHYERSPAYHNAVFADLLECLQVLEHGEIRDALQNALGPMARALAGLTHPDGRISLFGDGGLHMTYAPEECLRVYGALTGQRVFPEDRVDLAQAGYFGLRRGDNYFLARYGKIGPDFLPAHAHGDIFSFEWDVQGRRVIVDAGVYEYHPGQWRDYARSTAAHNTLTIDDEDQSEFWSAFRVGRRADVRLNGCRWDAETITVEGSHDGYARLAGGAIHRRRITSDACRVEVTDWVEHGQGQFARARLLCHPATQICRQGERIRIAVDGIGIDVVTNSPVRIDRAWWLPDFGQATETCQITMEYGSIPCQGGFSLVVQDR